MAPDDFSPNSKPAFLDPERANSIGYVGADEVPQFDRELEEETVEPAGKGPSRGYQERWRAIARLHALGLTSNQIGRKLGYSPTGISLALKQPFVQAEIERFRSAFEADIITRVKAAAQDGAEFIHETIHNEAAKVSERLDASKWAVEKATGKAKQEVGVESGTLMSFMELMRQMQPGSSPREVTESVPALAAPTDNAPPQDKFDSWLDENLK